MSEQERKDKYVNGQYQCKKKLGSGGFGEVWSCEDLLAMSKNPFQSAEDHTYAMKIEHLQDAEPSKDDEVKDPKAQNKKVPVPANQS